MSRSIHTTRRDLARLRQSDFADGQQKREQVRRLRGALRRKRAIKEAVAMERRGLVGAPLPTPLATIPVSVRDEGDSVHYPAGPADLQQIMQRLPAGMLDGLAGIDLCLGSAYNREQADWHEPDPHTGRHGSETLPGVYAGCILGVYLPPSARIQLFAYVYAPDLPDREVWEIYLRLQMLSTFVHEVAHHYDDMQRVARGRWRADECEVVEIYAERREYALVREIVLPYLEEAYPAEIKTLCDWIGHFGGISLPFADLADDPRTTGRGGLISGSAFFSMASALESLMADVRHGESLKTSRLAFANRLHYRERYDDALTIIGRVLADHPEDAEALILQADICVHQERYADAVSLALCVLDGDPAHLDALEQLSDAYSGLERWPLVIETNTRLLAVSKPHTWSWADALCERGIARVAIGDCAGAQADLALLHECPHRFVQGRITRLANALAEFESDKRPGD